MSLRLVLGTLGVALALGACHRDGRSPPRPGTREGRPAASLTAPTGPMVVDLLDSFTRASIDTDGPVVDLGEPQAAAFLYGAAPLRNETLGVHLPDGELRWLLVNTEPQRDQHGQPAGVVACFSDITQSRLLQDQLADSARTATASASMPSAKPW